MGNGQEIIQAYKKQKDINHLQKTFQSNEDQEDEPVCGELTQEKEEEDIKLTSPKEVAADIKENVNSKKAPGYDLITEEVLKELKMKVIIELTTLTNVAFGLKYVLSIGRLPR